MLKGGVLMYYWSKKEIPDKRDYKFKSKIDSAPDFQKLGSLNYYM